MSLSGGGDRDVSQESDPVLLLGAQAFRAESFGKRQGGVGVYRHRVTKSHAACFDQPEAAGKLGSLDQSARSEQIQMVGEPVSGQQFELRLAVEFSFDVLDLSQDSPIGIDPACGEIPGLEFREQRGTRTTKMRFVRLDPLFLDLSATFLEVVAGLEQTFLVRIVPQEIGTGLLAFDDHGPATSDAAFALANVEQGTGSIDLSCVTLEPSCDIDPPSGDGASDLGGDRRASEASQPFDREFLEFEVFGGLAGHGSPPCDPKGFESRSLFASDQSLVSRCAS